MHDVVIALGFIAMILAPCAASFIHPQDHEDAASPLLAAATKLN